jgi:hypothetical protein
MWFEGPPFEISALYAALIKIMWMAGFYIPLLPILLPIAFGSIFLIYWTSKVISFLEYIYYIKYFVLNYLYSNIC